MNKNKYSPIYFALFLGFFLFNLCFLGTRPALAYAKINSTGQIDGKWTERAFGQRMPIQEFATPYGFTGREFEESLGLNFHRARFYDPGVGRFMSRDPVFGDIGNPITQHSYVYGNLNPYRYSDPDGRWAQEIADWLRLKTLNPLKRGIGKTANVVQDFAGESIAIVLETAGTSAADYLLGIPIGVLSLGTLGGEGVGEIESCI